MTAVEALVCGRCGRRYAPGDVEYTCPEHDGVGGILDVRYDDERRRERYESEDDGAVADLWDFEALLPVAPGDRVSLGAGGTTLLSAPTLSDELGVTLSIKDETANPTGSSKDRGSAIVVTRAHQQGRDVVTCASTGNAAASLAGYAARAGLDCRIFVPADVPEAKAVQPRLYGADVLTVEGTYEDAYDLCRWIAAERGWHNGSAAINPYAVEGKQTLGFELGRQAPDADWVVLPMGNGCTLSAVWKGYVTFEHLGYVEGTPRFLGVQASGASPIYESLVDESTSVSADGGTDGTAADSIDVSTPHNERKAVRALRESDGTAVVVDDDHVLRAQRRIGESEGLFVEPASAAAVAGVERARRDGIVGPEDSVVVVATGTGLKDTATAQQAVDEDGQIEVSPDSVPDEF